MASVVPDKAKVELEAVEVLRSKVGRGKIRDSDTPSPFIVTYQILDRLPDDLRTAMLEAYGFPGKGAGQHDTAATVLARILDALVRSGDLDKVWIESDGVTYRIADREVVPAGYPVLAAYRLANRS